MALQGLDHYTIQCEDLLATRDFYCDGLGLEDGPRPDLGFAGHWLYLDGAPVVHLMACRDGKTPGADTGAFDHIAFRGQDAEAMAARLTARGIGFRENRIADFAIRQLFLTDPNGVRVEMNFRG